MIFCFPAKLIHLNSRLMKVYERQKIINGFGEKTDMKGIKPTEYHPNCGHSDRKSGMTS